jgi:streptomycin 6-kinase
VRIPTALGWWRDVPGGAEWLDRLPDIVEERAHAWGLDILEPLSGGHVSLVLAVERQGSPAVLKINFPEPESECEPDALRLWNGAGAVRLLEYDEPSRALILERCFPGGRLWDVEDDEEATDIAARVLAALWMPPPAEHRFASLVDVALRWSIEIPRDWAALGRVFERYLVDEAVAACLELGGEGEQQVVLHQDLHGGNVLRATREPWLAIDPKPLVGERAFDTASLLRDRRWLLEAPGAGARIRRRLDQLSSDLALDRERMRRWGIAHALAWGVSGRKVEHDMIECARLLAAAAS